MGLGIRRPATLFFPPFLSFFVFQIYSALGKKSKIKNQKQFFECLLLGKAARRGGVTIKEYPPPHEQ